MSEISAGAGATGPVGGGGDGELQGGPGGPAEEAGVRGGAPGGDRGGQEAGAGARHLGGLHRAPGGPAGVAVLPPEVGQQGLHSCSPS